VDAREADFSDRLTTKRQAYRVSSRRRRDGAVIEHEDQDAEEWSDEDEQEGLERKIARLRREIEEVRAETARQKGDEHGTRTGRQDYPDTLLDGGIESLSRALDSIRDSQRNAISAHAHLTKQLSNPPRATQTSQRPTSQTSAPTADDTVDTEMLSSIADFDTRLASLEKALGLGSLDISSSSQAASIIPILPTMSLLDKQLLLLTSTESHPHLEALVQKLQASHQPTKQPMNDGVDNAPQLTTEDLSKLRSLYSLLPTLTDLSPTLSPLLARLRSLRQLHAGAATASQDLEELERRQRETEQEIAEWRTGLEKVEEAVKQAETGIKGNADVVEGWVKELESRLKATGLDK